MNNEENRILVVDDEINILKVIRSYLEKDQYTVYEAANGNEALNLYDKINPNLILLDLMLPDISGEDICRIIRKKSKVPIIMLTAKSDEDNILYGLDIGADDYITKPFSPRQLVARVKALFRRTDYEKDNLAEIMNFSSNDLIVNTLNYEVKKKGNIVYLTPIEYTILITLIKYPSKVFTREEIISTALGDNYNGYDRTIDSHIKNLRQKIEDNPKNPDYILTIRGIGYKFGGS